MLKYDLRFAVLHAQYSVIFRMELCELFSALASIGWARSTLIIKALSTFLEPGQSIKLSNIQSSRIMQHKEFLNYAKILGNGKIHTLGSCVHKRECYHYAMLPPPPLQWSIRPSVGAEISFFYFCQEMSPYFCLSNIHS